MLKTKNVNFFASSVLICFCVLFFNLGIANADLCTEAIGPLAIPSVTAGTTIGATIDPEAPFCGTSVTSPGVWYTVLGTGGTMTVDTCTGTTYDSKISVFSGGCSVLNCIVGNDDACGLQSSVSFPSVAGTEYLILVHGFAGGSGDFDLNIDAGQIPILSTQVATSVATTSATLNGLVNANGSDSAVTFEYSFGTAYGNTIPAIQSPVTGSTDTAVSAALTSLAPATTYHFRVVAQNAVGTTYGADMTFTTNSAVDASIPTLSEWGMILMAMILGIMAIITLRRKTAN